MAHNRYEREMSRTGQIKDEFHKYDVVIIGAGPVGLLTANILGHAGLRVLCLESLPELINYPRGVGMDDECLRAFQSIGLTEKILPHVTPNQWMRFVNGKGRVFASLEPDIDVYGWPRRNAFVQPLVDQALAQGLTRYSNVELRFLHTMQSIAQDPDGVAVTVEGPNGVYQVQALYVVGCDGGRSATRKVAGIAFEGHTDDNRWIVVDLANDPVGRPNAYLHADPARPFVSIALPHGIRRFEFMLFPGEGEGTEVPRDVLNGMLAKVVPDPAKIDLIRARVYTHNGRIASQFRAGRILLAGDAAHIMPVWQGQGYNSGIRDATNLGWKLALVARGICDDILLDSYEVERRNHAKAMIDLSVTVGKVLALRNPIGVFLRDIFAYVAGLIPAVKRYFLEMRFKPMPRYRSGALDYGKRGISPESWVGRMFIQPRVTKPDGTVGRLDEVLGQGLALIAWGVDPTYWLTQQSRAILDCLDGRIITVVPETQLRHEQSRYPGAVVIGDAEGKLKQWFGTQPDGIIILRPDRFVAATCAPQEINEQITVLAKAFHFNPDVKRPVRQPASPLEA